MNWRPSTASGKHAGPRGKHGQEDTGGPTGHLLGSAIGVIVGIVWTVTATTMGAPIFFKLFGVVMIIGVLLTGLSNMDKATRYHQEKQRYWERRERLLRELKEQN